LVAIVVVNSAILVIASTTFFYNKPAGPIIEEADLVAMHQLLKTQLGAGLATLFAVSLWLSGNAASLTITMAGQSLSSGFLNYQTSPLIRRLITRTLGIIPATIIAAISAQKGINDMLIATQVAISIVLPFSYISRCLPLPLLSL
jgi:metal iron transporter